MPNPNFLAVSVGNTSTRLGVAIDGALVGTDRVANERDHAVLDRGLPQHVRVGRLGHIGPQRGARRHLIRAGAAEVAGARAGGASGGGRPEQRHVGPGVDLELREQVEGRIAERMGKAGG